MELTLVEFSKEEVQEKSDQIKKEIGYKPTDVQLIEALESSAKSAFPAMKVMRIAIIKNPRRLLFVLAPINNRY